MHMTREQIRERINLLENLNDLAQSIEDVGDVEFDPGEQGLVDIAITCRDDKRSIATVLGLPPAVVLAGLRDMLATVQLATEMRETPRRPRADIPDPFTID